MSTRLREHGVSLHGERIFLRPLTEEDWPLLQRWNNDPEVLYFSEGADVSARPLEDVQQIYRGVSQQAFCFVVELGGRPIGEGWLQRMNLARLLAQCPGLDCRRIDLAIGEKELWGQGLGTDIIRTLTRFGFGVEGADAIFGCDIGDYNPRSLRAFRRAGYRIHAVVEQAPRSKAHTCYDVVQWHDEWLARENRRATGG